MADKKNILKEALEAKKQKMEAEEAIKKNAKAILQVENKETLEKLVNESLKKLNESEDMDEVEEIEKTFSEAEGDYLEEDDYDDLNADSLMPVGDTEGEVEMDGEDEELPGFDDEGESEVDPNNIEEEDDIDPEIEQAINELREELDMDEGDHMDDEDMNEETDPELEQLLKDIEGDVEGEESDDMDMEDEDGDMVKEEEDELDIESLLDEGMDEEEDEMDMEDDMIDDLVEAVMTEMEKMDEEDEEEDYEEEMDESLSARQTHENGKKVPNRSKQQAKMGHTNKGKMSRTAADFRESYNRLKKENDQLSKTITELKEDFQYLNESSDKLMNILKLFVEHTTTKDEKMKIIERFETVSKKKDIEKLTEQIKKELNQSTKDDNLIGDKNVNVKINESTGKVDKVKSKKSFDEFDRIKELMNYKSNK